MKKKKKWLALALTGLLTVSIFQEGTLAAETDSEQTNLNLVEETASHEHNWGGYMEL